VGRGLGTRHWRSRRSGPGPASSTKPYLASWRRWNEQLAWETPSTRPHCAAVAGPVATSSSSRSRRRGCAKARIAVGSLLVISQRLLWHLQDVKAFFGTCPLGIREPVPAGVGRRLLPAGAHQCSQLAGVYPLWTDPRPATARGGPDEHDRQRTGERLHRAGP